MESNHSAVVEPEALDDLIGALPRRGFRVLGPTVRDGAIVYDDLESAAELPIGVTDQQEAGTYRLERRDDEARFGYAVGPHSWKHFLFPPHVSLWRARKENGGGSIEEEPLDETPLAFIGVRACELNGRSRSRTRSSSAASSSTATTQRAATVLPRRRQLRRARRELLLRLDGRRPARARRATTSRSPRSSRRASTASSSRSAARVGRRCSPSSPPGRPRKPTSPRRSASRTTPPRA